MGTIYRRWKKWYYGWKDKTGRWVYRSGSESLAETQKRLEAAEAMTDGTRVFLADLMQDYVRHVSAVHRGSRFNDKIVRMLDRFSAFASVERVPDVSGALIDRFLDAGQIGSLPDTRGPWSAGTANQARRILKAFFTWATVQELIVKNPALNVARRKGPPVKVRRAMSLDEARSVLSLMAPPCSSVCRFLTETGMRADEALRLRWRDLDLDAGMAAISAAHEKSRRGARVVILPSTAAWLREFRGAHSDNSREFVFHGARGRRLRERKVLDAFHAAKRAAGIARPEELDLHALRGTFATWAGQAGLDLAGIQAMLRHSTPNMTLKYCKPSQTNLRAWAASQWGFYDTRPEKKSDENGRTTSGGDISGGRHDAQA